MCAHWGCNDWRNESLVRRKWYSGQLIFKMCCNLESSKNKIQARWRIQAFHFALTPGWWCWVKWKKCFFLPNVVSKIEFGHCFWHFLTTVKVSKSENESKLVKTATIPGFLVKIWNLRSLCFSIYHKLELLWCCTVCRVVMVNAACHLALWVLLLSLVCLEFLEPFWFPEQIKAQSSAQLPYFKSQNGMKTDSAKQPLWCKRLQQEDAVPLRENIWNKNKFVITYF